MTVHSSKLVLDRQTPLRTERRLPISVIIWRHRRHQAPSLNRPACPPPSSVWSYLVMTGYLNAVDSMQMPIGGMLYRVAIPNKEVGLVYRTEVLASVRDVLPEAQVGLVQ